MNLFTKVSDKDIPLKNISGTGRPKFKKIECDFDLTGNLSSSAKFLIAPLIINGDVESGRVMIPLENPTLYNRILHDLGTCFESVSEVTSSQGVDLSFRSMRRQAVEKFDKELNEDHFLNKVLMDLYGGLDELQESQPDPNKQAIYKVDLQQIDSLAIKEMEEVWDLLKQSYISRNGIFSLLPNGWRFDESSFKNHLSIRWLASVCDEIFLSVSSNSNLIIVMFVR